MKKTMIVVLLLCTLTLSSFMFVLGQTEPLENLPQRQQPGLCEGDRFTVRGRGLLLHVEDGSRTRSRASLFLHCIVTDAKGPMIKFEVESGSITYNEEDLELQGDGGANLRSRRVVVHLDGDDVNIQMHGGPRMVRGRLALLLLGSGNIEGEHYRLGFLCLVKRK